VWFVRAFPNTKVGTTLTLLFDAMYEFFEEILGKNEKRSIKIYIVTLFFVIFVANMLWYTVDLIRVIFTDIEAIFAYIQIPTTSFNFNLALALVSIALMLILQFRSLNIVKFFLEYLPITGKWILDIERGTMAAWQYYPAKAVVKLFDIAISLFVGLLDIVGIFAKVLSLTARLYGNMLAWGILLWLLVVWVNSFTQNIASVDFPVIAPLILYAQGLLVTVIQAFVFPLLVAIFVKIAQGNE
jgi:F-type H+-transporting ATPase subunit a